MLVFNLKVIGNKLYEIRNKKLMSRIEVAEKDELSDRSYADIKRGNVNMRLDTLLKICKAPNVTPNDILTVEQPTNFSEDKLFDIINSCSLQEKQTALSLLSVYFDSLSK